jgi:predicted alpha/beta-fold hydrolase
MKGKGYEYFFCKELAGHFKKKTEGEKVHIDKLIKNIGGDPEKILNVKTWDQYNSEYTAKAFPEFSDPMDFYKAASAMNSLDKVTVPTLVVHSRDDPIIQLSCMKKDLCTKNPHIITAEV